jgi:hypothetical protein
MVTTFAYLRTDDAVYTKCDHSLVKIE